MDTVPQPGVAADALASAPGSAAAAPSAASVPQQPSNLDQTIRRRNSREWAVEMLFALDFAPIDGSLDDFFADFWTQQREIIIDSNDNPEVPLRKFDGEAAGRHRAFAERLVEGVRAHIDEIDARIGDCLDKWSIQRIGGTDRNVLRCAFYELFFAEDTPPAIIINEAIDIAKYFSTRESGKFVNGVLNRAAGKLDRPLRYRAPAPKFSAI